MPHTAFVKFHPCLIRRAAALLLPALLGWSLAAGAAGQRYANRPDSIPATPAITLSQSSLIFKPQAVGKQGGAMQLVIVNHTSAYFSTARMLVLGDYSASNCNGGVAPGAGCAISVHFLPTHVGLRQGALILPTQPSLIVPLMGMGIGAEARLSASHLDFGKVEVGRQSDLKSVRLVNHGTIPLQIYGVNTLGDFTQTNNCGPALAPLASCQLQIGFQPTGTGVRSGIIVIADNASDGGSEIVPLGEGTGPLIHFSSARLDFGSVVRDSVSPMQQITLTNTGNAPLQFSQIAVSGDFTQANTCISPMPAGLSCQITLQFHPRSAGMRLGNLSITSNAPGAPGIPLRGQASDFSLLLDHSHLKFKKDKSGKLQLTLLSVDGFSGPLSLQCNDQPESSVDSAVPPNPLPGSSCRFDPVQPLLDPNAGPLVVKLKIKVPAKHRGRYQGRHVLSISAVTGALVHKQRVKLDVE